MSALSSRRLTRRSALAFPLFLAACSTAPPPVGAPERRDLDALSLDATEALRWLNDYRAQSDLPPVRSDPELSALEQRQADAMAAADKLSHDIAGGFEARLAAAGVRAAEAGENVCAGYYSTEAAMTSWAHSPEHAANLRLRSATRFGIALAKNPRSRWGAFWAMAVASPAPEPS